MVPAAGLIAKLKALKGLTEAQQETEVNKLSEEYQEPLTVNPHNSYFSKAFAIEALRLVQQELLNRPTNPLKKVAVLITTQHLACYILFGTTTRPENITNLAKDIKAARTILHPDKWPDALKAQVQTLFGLLGNAESRLTAKLETSYDLLSIPLTGEPLQRFIKLAKMMGENQSPQATAQTPQPQKSANVHAPLWAKFLKSTGNLKELRSLARTFTEEQMAKEFNFGDYFATVFWQAVHLNLPDHIVTLMEFKAPIGNYSAAAASDQARVVAACSNITSMTFSTIFEYGPYGVILLTHRPLLIKAFGAPSFAFIENLFSQASTAEHFASLSCVQHTKSFQEWLVKKEPALLMHYLVYIFKGSANLQDYLRPLAEAGIRFDRICDGKEDVDIATHILKSALFSTARKKYLLETFYKFGVNVFRPFEDYFAEQRSRPAELTFPVEPHIEIILELKEMLDRATESTLPLAPIEKFVLRGAIFKAWFSFADTTYKNQDGNNVKSTGGQCIEKFCRLLHAEIAQLKLDAQKKEEILSLFSRMANLVYYVAYPFDALSDKRLPFKNNKISDDIHHVEDNSAQRLLYEKPFGSYLIFRTGGKSTLIATLTSGALVSCIPATANPVQTLRLINRHNFTPIAVDPPEVIRYRLFLSSTGFLAGLASSFTAEELSADFKMDQYQQSLIGHAARLGKTAHILVLMIKHVPLEVELLDADSLKNIVKACLLASSEEFQATFKHKPYRRLLLEDDALLKKAFLHLADELMEDLFAVCENIPDECFFRLFSFSAEAKFQAWVTRTPHPKIVAAVFKQFYCPKYANKYFALLLVAGVQLELVAEGESLISITEKTCKTNTAVENKNLVFKALLQLGVNLGQQADAMLRSRVSIPNRDQLLPFTLGETTRTLLDLKEMFERTIQTMENIEEALIKRLLQTIPETWQRFYKENLGKLSTLSNFEWIRAYCWMLKSAIAQEASYQDKKSEIYAQLGLVAQSVRYICLPYSSTLAECDFFSDRKLSHATLAIDLDAAERLMARNPEGRFIIALSPNGYNCVLYRANNINIKLQIERMPSSATLRQIAALKLQPLSPPSPTEILAADPQLPFRALKYNSEWFELFIERFTEACFTSAVSLKETGTGNTLLHLALLQQSHRPLCHKLLAAGADPFATNEAGQDPFAYLQAETRMTQQSIEEIKQEFKPLTWLDFLEINDTRLLGHAARILKFTNTTETIYSATESGLFGAGTPLLIAAARNLPDHVDALLFKGATIPKALVIQLRDQTQIVKSLIFSYENTFVPAGRMLYDEIFRRTENYWVLTQSPLVCARLQAHIDTMAGIEKQHRIAYIKDMFVDCIEVQTALGIKNLVDALSDEVLQFCLENCDKNALLKASGFGGYHKDKAFMARLAEFGVKPESPKVSPRSMFQKAEYEIYRERFIADYLKRLPPETVTQQKRQTLNRDVLQQKPMEHSRDFADTSTLNCALLVGNEKFALFLLEQGIQPNHLSLGFAVLQEKSRALSFIVLLTKFGAQPSEHTTEMLALRNDPEIACEARSEIDLMDEIAARGLPHSELRESNLNINRQV